MAKFRANAFLLHEGALVKPGTEIELEAEQAKRLGDKVVGANEKIDAERVFETEKPLDTYTVSDLRDIAQREGVENYSDLKKDELISAIESARQ